MYLAHIKIGVGFITGIAFGAAPSIATISSAAPSLDSVSAGDIGLALSGAGLLYFFLVQGTLKLLSFFKPQLVADPPSGGDSFALSHLAASVIAATKEFTAASKNHAKSREEQLEMLRSIRGELQGTAVMREQVKEIHDLAEPPGWIRSILREIRSMLRDIRDSR